MNRKALLAAAVAGASAWVVGCGSGGPKTITGSMSSSSWVTHADAVALLPMAHELAALIRPISAPNRHDQALGVGTLSSAFGPSTLSAMSQSSGAAELSITGGAGAQLYVQLFVFKTLAGAKSLTPAFLATTRLSHSAPPSGGAGQRRQLSSQPYGHDDLSYRYAFREQNVLCVVELDGPRRRYAPAEAQTVAAVADQHITTTLTPP
jgi:hypothetical protein